MLTMKKSKNERKEPVSRTGTARQRDGSSSKSAETTADLACLGRSNLLRMILSRHRCVPSVRSIELLEPPRARTVPERRLSLLEKFNVEAVEFVRPFKMREMRCSVDFHEPVVGEELRVLVSALEEDVLVIDRGNDEILGFDFPDPFVRNRVRVPCVGVEPVEDILHGRFISGCR